jgi:lysine 2,3-aminomutase
MSPAADRSDPSDPSDFQPITLFDRGKASRPMTPPPNHSVSRWKKLLAASIRTPDALAGVRPVDAAAMGAVCARYPMRINPYWLDLMRHPGDPFWRQAVPDPVELQDPTAEQDPLAEAAQSPVPGLIHRYPDRAIFLVSDRCAMYCRHCMRKRRVGRTPAARREAVLAAMDYIRATPAIREVILSGGDPLMLDDEALEEILARLRSMAHVRLLRIHTRMPSSLPQRITARLAALLRRFQPLYVNTQFNHPAEMTAAAAAACRRLADAGIPLGCQTVLLRGVNDNPATMTSLMRTLLEHRVRPYYLHRMDPVRGTAHFRTSVETGLKIMAALRGRLSGTGVPQFMIDLPGGGGKVPLLPEAVVARSPGIWRVRNYNGEVFDYPADSGPLPEEQAP